MPLENNSEIEKMEMFLILSGRWRQLDWSPVGGVSWWYSDAEKSTLRLIDAYRYESLRLEGWNA